MSIIEFKSKCQYANSAQSSMKTTLPKGMVDMFKLEAGDKIRYKIDFVDGEWCIRLVFEKKE